MWVSVEGGRRCGERKGGCFTAVDWNLDSPSIHLFSSFLDDVCSAGEHAQEFLELMKSLTKDSSGKWKSYLAMRGVLPQIGALITREIEHLQYLEETTLNSDLSQGCALKMLTG